MYCNVYKTYTHCAGLSNLPHSGLAFKFAAPNVPKTLAVNIWVEPMQEIWLSTSHADTYLIHGTTSERPVAFA